MASLCGDVAAAAAGSEGEQAAEDSEGTPPTAKLSVAAALRQAQEALARCMEAVEAASAVAPSYPKASASLSPASAATTTPAAVQSFPVQAAPSAAPPAAPAAPPSASYDDDPANAPLPSAAALGWWADVACPALDAAFDALAMAVRRVPAASSSGEAPAMFAGTTLPFVEMARAELATFRAEYAAQRRCAAAGTVAAASQVPLQAGAAPSPLGAPLTDPEARAWQPLEAHSQALATVLVAAGQRIFLSDASAGVGQAVPKAEDESAEEDALRRGHVSFMALLRVLSPSTLWETHVDPLLRTCTVCEGAGCCLHEVELSRLALASTQFASFFLHG